ncbi:MAG TPA: chemotaxis signal transduction protein CheV [Phycisphaerales bacterium]|nr:chemotaxis signal transduction protein CheV [Phycisphaerales bacterium]
MATHQSSAASMVSGGTPGDILLDAGTNELEVLVFRMGKGWFGVNVAKVREVIRGEKPSETPNSHPSIMGMINKRGVLVPLVDLAGHLGIKSVVESIEDARIIITEFNGMTVGFVVDDVQRIHRVSWGKVRPAPEFDDGAAEISYNTCTGIIDLDDRLILMIDFESITDAIRMEDRLHVGEVENTLGVDRASVRVVMAEDSSFMREMLGNVFKSSGYGGIQIYSDGTSAWNAIKEMVEQGEKPDIVVSDIEMPGTDGLRLTKLIKEDPALDGVPVVLFSSLITEENLKKGKQVGADIQIPKPELAEIVRLVDRYIHGGIEALRGAA